MEPPSLDGGDPATLAPRRSTGTGFNGAAVSRRRRRPRPAGRRRSRWRCFNGAAVSRRRRRAEAESAAHADARASMEPPSLDGGDPINHAAAMRLVKMLQWSRRLSTAETPASSRRCCRRVRRFNGAAVSRRRRPSVLGGATAPATSCFNGAAVSRRRRPMALLLGASLATTRFNGAAVSRRRRHCWPGAQARRPRPRFNGAAVLDGGDAHASRVGHLRHGVVASMEPPSLDGGDSRHRVNALWS